MNLLPDTQRVASIDVFSENVVWGVAFYDKTPAPVPSDLVPYVVRTTNGGDEWEAHPIEEVQGRICQDIFVVDDHTAWITTNGLTADSLRGLFKTTDGGVTWVEKFDSPAGGGMIHFFDDSIGIAIHETFMAYTFDAGDTWDDVSSMNNLPFNFMERIFYTAANNAFAVVGDTIWFGTTQGRIFRSLNRGFDWEAIDTPFESNEIIISTAFRNATDGIAISYAQMDQDAISFMDDTKVAVTYDGGVTWELSDTISNFKVSCITGVPGNNSQFLGATNGLSTLTTDSTQTWQNFSFRPYNAVEFLNDELGWVGNSQTSEDHPAVMYKWEGIISSNKDLVKSDLEVKVFPNPFSQSFILQLNVVDFQKLHGENLILEIYDLLGKRILEREIHNSQVEILFPKNESNGMYFLNIKNQNEVVSISKLILKKD
ncbi:MAG: T9SS type A sorting domain-containing protein [Bacteroidota bacterium]